jgi:hypothetical protein
MTSLSNSDRRGEVEAAPTGVVEESAVMVPGATGQTTGDWLHLINVTSSRHSRREMNNKLSAVERGTLAENFRRAQAVAAPSGDSETNQLLRRFLIPHSDPYVTISESHFSRDDSEAVKKASVAYYQLAGEKYCQVLGAVDPNQVSVINAHIWPRHATAELPLFDLEPHDIHDARNVLRLQKDIERAFDLCKLAFLQNGSKVLVRVLIVATPHPSCFGFGATSLFSAFLRGCWNTENYFPGNSFVHPFHLFFGDVLSLVII